MLSSSESTLDARKPFDASQETVNQIYQVPADTCQSFKQKNLPDMEDVMLVIYVNMLKIFKICGMGGHSAYININRLITLISFLMVPFLVFILVV